MSKTPILAGVDLYKIIPQRPPIVEVDTLYDANESGAHTALTVAEDNFLNESGYLQESGLIEHIAQ